MPAFFKSTADIPAPEKLGSGKDLSVVTDFNLWASNVAASVKKLEKHGELLARALNATAQLAWGNIVDSVYTQDEITINGVAPVVLVEKQINYPTKANIVVWYQIPVEVLSQLVDPEEVVVSILIDGIQQPSSITRYYDGANATTQRTLSGVWLGSIKKATITNIGLAINIEGQVSGEIKTRDSAGFVYNLTPRLE